MIAGDLKPEAGGLLRIEPAKCQHPVLEIGQRLENRAQGEFARFLLRELVLQVHDAIRHLEEPQAGRPYLIYGKGRGHGVQQRQGKGCPCPI